MDVYDSSRTNESQAASSKFRFKKVRGKRNKKYMYMYILRWRRVQGREREEEVLLNFLLDTYPTLQKVEAIHADGSHKTK